MARLFERSYAAILLKILHFDENSTSNCGFELTN